MSATKEPTPGPVLLLLGGTGDLTRRMLLPSLYHLEADRLLPEDLRVIGVARASHDAEDYRRFVRDSLAERERLEEPAWRRFAARLDYHAGDVTHAEDAKRLAAAIGDHGELVIYCAISPSLFAPSCQALAAAGLVGPQTRIVLEKPIGRDLASAQALNQAIGAVAAEEQIFRIDHYLGKETVQNLIALRFANLVFEPLWNSQCIDHVQITVAETEGVGDRWAYYDDYGAFRDMLQNHML